MDPVLICRGAGLVGQVVLGVGPFVVQGPVESFDPGVIQKRCLRIDEEVKVQRILASVSRQIGGPGLSEYCRIDQALSSGRCRL